MKQSIIISEKEGEYLPKGRQVQACIDACMHDNGRDVKLGTKTLHSEKSSEAVEVE
jgi:hypothetical protein